MTDHPKLDDAYRMGAKGSEAIEQERLAFEAWMKGHCWSMDGVQWNGKGYFGPGETIQKPCWAAMRVREIWAAWRDRAALANLNKTKVAK